MTTLFHTLRMKCRTALLVGVSLSALLTPAGALAAEREGTRLFFSQEELQQVLAHPSLPSLTSLLLLPHNSSSLAWREQSGAAEQDRSLKRNTRSDNWLWVDGYRLPGPHPLWGD